MTLNDVPTPALLLDRDLFESNLKQMAAHVAGSGKRLRPHAKAHKCIEIAKRQIALGAVGICVATVSEAELMAGAGLTGILLTSPIADTKKCERIASLAPKVSVVVDHERQVCLYAKAAHGAGVALEVLVDIDVGDHRTGVAPLEPALCLVQQIASTSTLTFAGLQAYSVCASHLEDEEARAEYTRRALEPVQQTRDMIETSGIAVPLISGASTGSYEADCRSPALTEIQAGSYPLMDLAYRRIGIGFENALTVLATVVSSNHSDHVTIDAGFKAFSTDRPFGPELLDHDESGYQWAGDEFGYIYPADGCRMQLGDRVRLIPPHCDPTVNLYDRLYVHRGEVVEDVWPIMNRSAAGVT
jgi:D-serine deaminase-like pyridoxal phosphate-dependent protein